MTPASRRSAASPRSPLVGKLLSPAFSAGATASSMSPVNIGAVKVGGDWVASNLSAGVEGTSGNFGESTDTVEAASSKIASITIGGVINGNSSATTDHYGFDATAIGSFSFNKINLGTITAPATIPLAPILNDVAIELK